MVRVCQESLCVGKSQNCTYTSDTQDLTNQLTVCKNGTMGTETGDPRMCFSLAVICLPVKSNLSAWFEASVSSVFANPPHLSSANLSAYDH